MSRARQVDASYTLRLTGVSDNAAVHVTLHSAASLGFEGSNNVASKTSKEERLRKRKARLVVDSIRIMCKGR
ncbi:hypothetical protein PG993_014268 [Apiospora rasikravindrae]|uniref:Uncharacterized protein n=1 Tax=Apiospora rasikravindrae TaxID=990691 RepID=A0ABR1RM90_9PEZI